MDLTRIKVGFNGGNVRLDISPNCEIVTAINLGKQEKNDLNKTRPDDFILELKHIEKIMIGSEEMSPISSKYGLETALVIAAAHRSAKLGKTVNIKYENGFNLSSLF